MDNLSNCQTSPRPPKGGFLKGFMSDTGFVRQVMFWLFLISFFVQGAQAQIKRVPVEKPAGGFEIDGNLFSNNIPLPESPGGDWLNPGGVKSPSGVFWWDGSQVLPVDPAFSV